MTGALVPCAFNVGNHEKSSQRPKCEVPAVKQIQVAKESWLYVCEDHLKDWAKFNGTQWWMMGRPKLPKVGV